MVARGDMYRGDIQEIMPITASTISATLRWEYMGQQMQQKRYFAVSGAAFATATPEGVGEAYWNHVKTVWRALVPSAYPTVFRSVLIEEVGGALGYGEYAIPVGEQGGTRTGTLGDGLPSFVNAGIRFTVGTRLTRPAQMRIPFAHESDATGNAWTAGWLTLVNALANVYKADMTLGAPVATGVLHMVVPKAPVPPVTTPDVFQLVVGAVVNSNVTSQNSRKQGRGN